MPFVADLRRLTTLERFGVAYLGGHGALEDYPLGRLPFGWYADWGYSAAPQRPRNIAFVQTVPVDERYPPDWQQLRDAVAANRGALWLIGNEPECEHQGRRTPEEYADIYHSYYTFIKGIDSSARIAIGGVVQVTPLRLEWLERVLAYYQAVHGQRMPVDVWNIHIQILQEKRDDYGCKIPVGLDADEGMIYPWWQSDSTAVFQQQVSDFRQWMQAQGERDKWLIISEYGILYPASWFDTLGEPGGEARIKAYMGATFDYLLTARDPETGCPSDGNRLVQQWQWFSLNSLSWQQDPIEGFEGSLCDPFSRQLTPYGQEYERLLERILS